MSVLSNPFITGSPGLASWLFNIFLSPSLYFFKEYDGTKLPVDGAVFATWSISPLLKTKLGVPKVGQTYSLPLNLHLDDFFNHSALLNDVDTCVIWLPEYPIVFKNSSGFTGTPLELNIPNTIFLGLYLLYGSVSSSSGVSFTGASESEGKSI